MKSNRLLVLSLLILCGIAVFKANAHGLKKSLVKIVFESDFGDLSEGEAPIPSDDAGDDDADGDQSPADEADGE